MPIKPEIPDKIPQKDLQNAVYQINYLLRPGDPSPQEGRHRSWQKCVTLALQNLLDGVNVDELFEAKWTWRYLISFISQDALYATFDKDLKIKGLSRGPKATVAVRAARELRSLPEIRDGEYQVRVLTIPGLLTEAFLLGPVGGQPADRFVIPFFTAQDLRCGYPYSAGAFFELAAEMAAARKESGPMTIGMRADRPDNVNAQAHANLGANALLANAEARIADEDRDRQKAAIRRVMAEMRRKKKATDDASAQEQAWKRALG